MSARGFVIEGRARLFAGLLLGVLALRIAVLLLSPLEFHFDEAQYWVWSHRLDWGYFSKPPLIAWIIAATTAIFGDAEWAVRLGSPLAHTLGALMIFALARRAYDEEAALWAGALWLLLPAIWLSSAIMSTDALLLPAWAAALYCFWRLQERPSWTWAALLGLAIGLGALAKYAMLYFPLCAALAAWWAKPARAALLSAYGATAALVAALVLAPNLIWNAANRFETVAHTASNVNLKADFFNPGEAFEFIGAQAAVIGPVLFVALGWLFWRLARTRPLEERERTLLAFVAPPLLIIMAQALISRANANWAATAYPAAIVLLVGRLLGSQPGRRVLWAALATQIVIGAIVLLAGLSPAIGDRIGMGPSMKRVRGWEEMAQEIALRAAPAPIGGRFDAILVDHRAVYFELAYYWRDERAAGADLPPVRAWRLHAAPENDAEAADPMRTGEGARVLVVHMVPRYEPLVAADFARFTPLDVINVPLGPRATRRFAFSIGEGFAPAPRDAAFEARLKRMNEEDD